MDPLSDEQLCTLQAKMLEERDRLRELLEQTKDDVVPVDLELPIGRLSRMDAIQQQKMAEAAREGYERQHHKIEAALRRLAQGEYGECVECGETIAFKRLLARPETRYCIDCQETRER
jgi:DnaK suppressor protein